VLGCGDDLRIGVPGGLAAWFKAGCGRSARDAVDPDALRDDQGARIKDLIPGGRRGQRGPRCDNRRFVGALLWMARSGARWRDLPERLGDHRAVKRRYYGWIERGVLDQVLTALSAEADLEWRLIDSTIIRAHQHAAGAPRAKGGRMPKVWAARAAV